MIVFIFVLTISQDKRTFVCRVSPTQLKKISKLLGQTPRLRGIFFSKHYYQIQILV